MTEYKTTTESNGKLKRGPMVSVPERKFSEPVPDTILTLIDGVQLVIDDNDHAYILYDAGRGIAAVWGPSVEGDWFVRIGEPDAFRAPTRDDALRAAIRPSLLKKHDYDELIWGGYWCTACTPDDIDVGVDGLVSWPCPTLRDAGLTDEEALQHIEDDRAAIEAARWAPGKAAVEQFNAAHPVGTPVKYWPGARSGEPRTGQTIEPAAQWLGRTATVRVRESGTDKHDHIALTHIQVATEQENADA